MYEFETFAYLDVPKTASTFIGGVLESFCTEEMVSRVRHGGLKGKSIYSKLYFISVRDPLDQYVSLYSYGCCGKGQVFENIRAKGRTELYDATWRGFEYWLEYMLDPENAVLFETGYRPLAEWIGYQSFRVFRLAVPDCRAHLAKCDTKKELRSMYESRNVVNSIIRYETLRDDLCSLVTNELNYCMRLPEAEEYIRNTPPKNSSERIDYYMETPTLRPRVRRLLFQREWLLGELFG